MPKKTRGFTPRKKVTNLPDTQNTPSAHAIPLQKVGIRDFMHPAFVGEGTWVGEVERIDAQPGDFSMYVDLDAKSKGISMSRLPRMLSKLTYENRPVLPQHSAGSDPVSADRRSASVMNIMRAWTQEIVKDIPGSKDAYIKCRVKVPKWKRSPVSLLRGIEYYETVFEAKNHEKGGMRYFITLKVRYISTCPCSLHLSQHAEKHIKGVKRANPHMQPSYATITVAVGEFTFLDHTFIHQLIVTAEKALVTIPYPMVKREDEQAIAIACGKHQMFCEDAARILAKAVDNFNLGVKDWVVVCDHDESIHSHFATAITWKGLPNGLR